MIRRVFESKPHGYTVSLFAVQLNCDRTNIYSIFRRPTIDTELLARISRVLEHDFFRDLSEDMLETDGDVTI